MQRKLLFGLSLMLALASMYAGLFGWRYIQYGLVAMCVVVAIAAMLSTEAVDAAGHTRTGGQDAAPRQPTSPASLSTSPESGERTRNSEQER